MARAARTETGMRREQIVAAAMQVIAEYGMSGLSIARIAERVGVVPSAVYRHFRGRSDIVSGVLDGLRAAIVGNLDRSMAESQTALDGLRLMHARHAEFIRRTRSLPQFLFSDEVFIGDSPGRKRLEETLAYLVGRLTEVVRSGQDDGSISRDLDAGAVALMFVGLFPPTAMLCGPLNAGPRKLDRTIAGMWDAFERAVRA